MAGEDSASSSGSPPDSSSPATKAEHAEAGPNATQAPSRSPKLTRATLLSIPAVPILVLVAAIWLAYVNHVALPAPAPSSVLPSEFSEGRVRSFLNAFTSGVRTLGSCNNELFAPLLMLRYIKEEILGFGSTSDDAKSHEREAFSTGTAPNPEAGRNSSTSSAVKPVVLHVFPYYLQATYGPPASFPAFSANRKPPSHAEGAPPRVYPPALVSSLTLCSVTLEAAAPESSDRETISAELIARLSALEVPLCSSQAESRRVCEGASGSTESDQKVPGEHRNRNGVPVATVDAEALHLEDRSSPASLRAFVETAVDAYDEAIQTRLSAFFQSDSATPSDLERVRGALYPPSTVPGPVSLPPDGSAASSSVWWPGTMHLRRRCFKIMRYLVASAEAANILRAGRQEPMYEEALKSLLVVDVSSSSAFTGGNFNWRDGRHALYSGLYNLALRIQPLGVMEAERNREQSALLLSAHSDSASGSPGGSDDAAMVATIFEVARNVVYSHLGIVEKTLKRSARPERATEKTEKAEGSEQKLWKLEAPLLIDINGAEEIGLLGAHGFATLHPFARQIAYAVNLESAGRGGKETLVQTTGPHGTRLVAHYKSVSVSPHASSLAMDVGDMGLFPGETDMRVWRDVLHVKGGIEFAWTTGGFFYHTKFDNVHRMRPGAIQRVGELVLSLSRVLTTDLAAERARQAALEKARGQKGDTHRGRKGRKSSSGARGGSEDEVPAVLGKPDSYTMPGNALSGGSVSSEKTRESRAGTLWEKLPETSWPRSSSFFADVLGRFLFVCPLRFFELLLLAALVLLRMQIRLEADVLGLTFSLPLVLLAVGSLLISLVAPLVITALASQLLAFLSLPLLTFWDWRVGTPLFGAVGFAAFFLAWHQLLFHRLFKRFPARRHPFKAEQAALHGTLGVSLLLLAVLRYTGARAAFVPLVFVLLISGTRCSVLALMGSSRRSVTASRREEEAPRRSDASGTEKAQTGGRSKKPRETGPGEKALILSVAHSAVLVLPTVAISQVILDLAETIAAVLGRVHSVWGLGDSFGFTVTVFPLLFLFPLLVAPPLFFALHHAHSREAVSVPSSRELAKRRRSRQSVLSLWMVLVAVGVALAAFGVVFFHTNAPEETLREALQYAPPGVRPPESLSRTPYRNLWQNARVYLGQAVSTFLPAGGEDQLFPFSKETPLRLEVRLFSRKRVRGFNRQMEVANSENSSEEVGILLRGVSPSGNVLDPTSRATSRILEAVHGALSAALAVGEETGEKEGGTGEKDLSLGMVKDVKFVHFEGMSPEETQQVMLRFPQIPVAQNKGHAIAMLLSSEKAKGDKETTTLASPQLLLPPHAGHSQTSGKGPTVSSPIFLHRTTAYFSSHYDASADVTQCHIRIGGASLFSLLLPASPIVGWSLDKTMNLERIKSCDCVVLTVFAPHPPVLAEFSLTLKGRSGLTFSSTSSLMDPLEPIARCRESSLFEVTASLGAFSSSTVPCEEHRKAFATARRHRRKVGKGSSGGEKNERLPHVLFWEELENRLPEYVAGTYYAAEHIQWEVPPPPFEGRFTGGGRE
ncbi:peptidase, M28 family protein [Toxoplasma gondii MAS]|uniref:Peptidase, M28 family protein n=1 Tax=Toxoplasma gondii MAS TaxID=943118 RepID=A0A086QMZ3_TOXGO|nr:peptidase, M28 family protein [Toxoplasma gondii MAS]